ncbi:MAG: hypothetical protein H7Z41_20025 [Cytophagales bacterium]|nr:hypothetical protein [Armatimonadota bacterium]
MIRNTNGNNGGGSSDRGPAPSANRPAATEAARIEGTLTHLLIGDATSVDGWNLFVNAQAIPTGEIESISIEIIAPTESSDGTLTGLLSRYVPGTEGQGRSQRSVALFPGTVEVIGKDRRITVTCQQPGSFDGLWLGLGLRSDGTSAELTGVQSLRILASPGTGLLDARLTWADTGATEDLLG